MQLGVQSKVQFCNVSSSTNYKGCPEFLAVFYSSHFSHLAPSAERGTTVSIWKSIEEGLGKAVPARLLISFYIYLRAVVSSLLASEADALIAGLPIPPLSVETC